MRAALLAALLGFFTLVALAAPAAAHNLTPTRATLVLRPARYDLSLEVGWHALSAGATDPEAAQRYLSDQLHLVGSARAAWLDRLRVFFRAAARLRCDGRDQPLAFTFPALEDAAQAELPAETLPTLDVEATGTLPPGTGRCALEPSADLGSIALAVRRPDVAPDDRRLLTPGEASPPFALAGDASNGVMAERATADASPSPRPPEPTLVTYLVSGFEHILPGGIDHVLFVLGLFFLGAGTRLLLYQVTAFTVAHSLTLALGLLGWARLPAGVVEPAIAASIAFVALENLYARDVSARRRVGLVFAFGLLHGLGFAGALQAAELPMGRLLTTLLGFNLGVEGGQLAVLAGAALLTLRARRWGRYEAVIRRPACLAIAGMGLYWTVIRLFFAA